MTLRTRSVLSPPHTYSVQGECDDKMYAEYVEDAK